MIQKLIKLWNEYQLNEKEHEQAKKIDLAVNGLLKIVFNEKQTFESIKIKEKFLKQFNNEIAKRGLDAHVELVDCEEYLTKNN
jgi:DNA-binding protein YbaB